MADIAIIEPVQSGSAPLSYRLADRQALEVLAVHADFDGSGAGGSFVPAVSYYAPDGKKLGTFTGTTIAAGSSGGVTWFPFAPPSSSTGPSGSGIQFDTYPQSGTFLETETTGTLSAADGTDLHTRFPALTAGQWQSFGTLLLDTGGNDIGIVQPAGGTIDIIATKSSSAVLNIQAHQTFEDYGFQNISVDSVYSLGTASGGAIDIAEDGGGTGLSHMVLRAGNSADIRLEIGDGSTTGNLRITLHKAGNMVVIRDHTNAPIFEVREDGSIHGLAAVGAITWDL